MQPLYNTDSYDGNGKLPCPQCDRSFARREHLRRHLRNHGNLKRFTCPLCCKSFARSDVLAKHRAAHDGERLDSQVQGSGNTTRKSRACLACAKARERCTKEAQCLRCTRKSISCVYPQADAVIPAPIRSQYPTASVPETCQATSSQANLPTPDRSYIFSQPTISPHRDDNYVASPVNELGSSVLPLGWPVPDEQWLLDGNVVSRQAFGVANSSVNWFPFDEILDPDLGSVFGAALEQLVQPEASWAPLEQNIHQTHTRSHENAGESQNSPTSGLSENHCTSPTASMLGGSLSVSSTPSHLSTSKSTRGNFYATSSNGARNSCATRVQGESFSSLNDTAAIATAQQEDDDGLGLLSFPSLEWLDLPEAASCNSSLEISEDTYNVIIRHFQDSCMRQSVFLPRFTSEKFLPLAVLNHFVTLYFKYFDHILPFIHYYTVNMNGVWILAVAIASVGCQYAKSQELRSCIAPLQEFCRRSVQLEIERNRLIVADLNFLQAQLLNQISLTYSGCYGSQRTTETCSASVVSLIGIRSHEGLHDCRAMPPVTSNSWHQWVQTESWRRLYFAASMLRCMMSYHFNFRLEASQDIADIDLPNEKLWRADTASHWFASYQEDKGSLSLRAAMSKMFKEKSVSTEIGDFSHCIILHELFNEISKVTIFHSRELAMWPPTTASPRLQLQELEESATKQEQKLTVLGHSVTQTTAISDWRNAALDCIDVLHWAANAKIALLSGAEHPVVLHLHYSRVVLLVPRVALMTVASSALKASDGILNDNKRCQHDSFEAVGIAERHIREWAQRDSSKARLAAIHSGCFFWHIRRYSRAAFYEPIAIFYATLALWAYGLYTPKTVADPSQVTDARTPNLSDQAGYNDGEDSCSPLSSQSLPASAPRLHLDRRDPAFIYLDRPNDDEMVQLFVGSGKPAKMSALVSGVGDICSPEGPARILREGRALLTATSRNWLRDNNYINTLLALEKVTVEKSIQA